jgi:hypothetical protein
MEYKDQHGLKKSGRENFVPPADQDDERHHAAVESRGDYGKAEFFPAVKINNPECPVHPNNDGDQKTG